MPLMLSDHAIIIADRNGVIQIWNAQAVTLLGYSASFAIGQTLDILIPESSRPGHWAAYQQVMNSGETKEGVTKARFLCQDGQIRIHELRLIVLLDIHGNSIGAMNIIEPYYEN